MNRIIRQGIRRSRCKVCREPIAQDAKKCIHCTSYQDFRSYIGFGSTILSLLVALIAVSTPFVESIYKSMHDRESSLKFSIADVNYRTISVMVKNEGDAAGTLSGGMLEIDGQYINLDLPSGPVLIGPNQTALLTYLAQSEPRTDPIQAKSCLIIFISDNSKNPGDRGISEVNVNCELIRSVFPRWGE